MSQPAGSFILPLSIPVPFTCFYACIVVENEEDQEALNEIRKRRPPFRFNMAHIPVGAELVFSRDENIKAKVIDNRFIEINGKKTRLSTSAQEILGYDYGVAGTDYWMYDGETLDERRRRFEEGNNDEPSPEEIEAAGDAWIQSEIDKERGK